MTRLVADLQHFDKVVRQDGSSGSVRNVHTNMYGDLVVQYWDGTDELYPADARVELQ